MRRMMQVALGVALLGLIGQGSANAEWPDLSKPPAAVGGGEKDAAVIVGVEQYAFVPDVPGAGQNAADWYAYLTKARGVPHANVTLLRNEEGTRENLAHFASVAAGRVQAGGTLWFVFVGHGAPALDGKDGMLVGADAQQQARSLGARSLPQSELLQELAKGAQAQTVVVIDACFSGRTGDGKPLAPGLQPLIPVTETGGAPANKTPLVLLTAGKANEFAGPLPGTGRPAFSYLTLGALRGWADADKDGAVTATEVVRYSQDVLRMMVKDRTQTPELSGPEGARLALKATEVGPDLGALVIGPDGGPDEPDRGGTWKTRGDMLVRITSLPPGAQIKMGKHEATTPIEAHFRPGSYTITFSKPYHETVKEKIKVRRAGPEVQEFNVVLKATFGIVDVVVEPHDAEVVLDGQGRGKGSMRLENLAVGGHELVVQHPSYYAETRTVAVAAGDRKEVSLELKPKKGLLEIKAHSKSGKVLRKDVHVDGKFVGTTPFKGEVVMGERRVSVRDGGPDRYVTVPHNAEATPIEVVIVTKSSRRTSSQKSFGTLGWVGLITASVGAGAAAIFLASAQKSEEEITSAKSTGAMSQQQAFDRMDEVDRDKIIAYTGLGVAVVGAVLLFTDLLTPDDDESTADADVPRLRLQLGADGGFVTYDGRF